MSYARRPTAVPRSTMCNERRALRLLLPPSTFSIVFSWNVLCHARSPERKTSLEQLLLPRKRLSEHLVYHPRDSCQPPGAFYSFPMPYMRTYMPIPDSTMILIVQWKIKAEDNCPTSLQRRKRTCRETGSIPPYSPSVSCPAMLLCAVYSPATVPLPSTELPS